MKKIDIEKTNDSPHILFDPEDGKLIIRGHSYPENTFIFYEKLLKSLREYFNKNYDKKLDIEIDIDLYNFSTAQTIFNFFNLFDEYKDKVGTIKWFYDDKQDLTYENFEDFFDEFKDLNIVPIKKEVKE